MISQKNLLKAIEDCENSLNSFQGYEKLSALYTVYDHLYGELITYEDIHVKTETVIEADESNEFFQSINGKKANEVWKIMSELMESVKLIQPRLYEAVMKKPSLIMGRFFLLLS